MKTAVQEVIEKVEKEEKATFSREEVISMLKITLIKERDQIETAVTEGIKYGNGPLQTFDYPAARYYSHTYIF